MSNGKNHRFRPPLYHGDPNDVAATAGNGQGQEPPPSEQQGWDAYRKWLSRVSMQQPARRSARDVSIYSWRGYNSWADKIRQNWKTEES